MQQDLKFKYSLNKKLSNTPIDIISKSFADSFEDNEENSTRSWKEQTKDFIKVENKKKISFEFIQPDVHVQKEKKIAARVNPLEKKKNAEKNLKKNQKQNFPNENEIIRINKLKDQVKRINNLKKKPYEPVLAYKKQSPNEKITQDSLCPISEISYSSILSKEDISSINNFKSISSEGSINKENYKKDKTYI